MGHISEQEIDAMIASEERYDAMRRVTTRPAPRVEIDRTEELRARAEAAQPMRFFAKDWEAAPVATSSQAPAARKDWGAASQDRLREIMPPPERSKDRDFDR